MAVQSHSVPLPSSQLHQLMFLPLLQHQVHSLVIDVGSCSLQPGRDLLHGVDFAVDSAPGLGHGTPCPALYSAFRLHVEPVRPYSAELPGFAQRLYRWVGKAAQYAGQARHDVLA